MSTAKADDTRHPTSPVSAPPVPAERLEGTDTYNQQHASAVGRSERQTEQKKAADTEG